jgi:O-antigen ligase
MSGGPRRPSGLLAAFVVGLLTSITLAQVVLSVLVVRLVLRVATGRSRVGGWPMAVPFAAWVVASLATAALAEHPVESLVSAVRGLALIATFYVVLDDIAGESGGERLTNWLLALAGLIGAIAIAQVALCPSLAPLARVPLLDRVVTKCARAHGFYSIYMTLAGVLNVVLLATLPRLVPGPAGKPSAWRLVASATAAAALAFTHARGAWLGFLAGVTLSLGLLRRGRVWLIAAVALVGVAVLVVPGVRMRAASIADPKDPTALERLAMWRSGLAMVLDHPLTGIGPGQVKHEYATYAAPEYHNRPRGHLHNTPLQILVERGLVGLLAWASIFVAFFWHVGRFLARARRARSTSEAVVAGSLAAVAGFLVAGLTEYNFGDSEVVLVLYTVMAVPFALMPGHGAEAGGDRPVAAAPRALPASPRQPV